ncbi:MAG TPA: VOC family protein, partial [Candidatus Dormibacteraeota bacterium]
MTAITGDAQRNVDFYVGLLGLRLVKKTVNFDDPGSYHLYFGDELGRPGSVMTFFVWPGATGGLRGPGQVTATAFSVPAGSLGWWAERLTAAGVRTGAVTQRWADEVLAFTDPEGLALELVARAVPDPREPWAALPAEVAIRGFHSVTLSLVASEPTARLLTGTLGFRAAGEDAGRSRFATGDAGG